MKNIARIGLANSQRTDVFSARKRSEVMSKIKGKDTTPEIRVRSALHRMGFRFRLHRRDLPGCPDIYIPRLGLTVFVNGCFWHLHPRCKDARLPKSNIDFWREKLYRNRQRDAANARKLRRIGKQVLVLWECDVERHQHDLCAYIGAILSDRFA
ncbi:MAG TPA: very short patch repair endonuclease [Candidatus Angelobacter sp.]|nr:very short patch repair endonuclease [Candidatus Angelobacter sp.]